MIAAIQWETIAASVVISGTIVVLVVGLIRLAPWGTATVETLRELADTRFEKITEQERTIVELRAKVAEQLVELTQARSDQHATELLVAERDTRIAVLEAQPDTAKMLATLEHMIRNQETMLESIAKLQPPTE